jgi:hypothetical protein
MALYADRVKDSTSITGTGAITLSGTAPTGFQSFATAFGASPQTVAYCIADQTGNNWEVGTGVFNGTTGLTRVTVLGSSNGGSLVNFTGGTQDVFCTAPAAYLLPAGANTQIQYNNAGVFGGSANFTYTSGTNTLNVGPVSATATIKATDTSATSTSGGQITLRSGDGLFLGTSGGSTLIRGGNGTTVSGNGGALQLSGGNGYGNGGNLELAAGFANSGTETGGNFTALGGERNVSGGNLDFSAGGGNVGSGGSVNFSSGGSGSAAGGSINFGLQGGATDDGEITFKNPNGETYAYFKNDVPGGVQQIGFFNAIPVFKPAPTASGTQAVLDSVVSSLNSLGLVDATALTNATVITPAGSTTQIQFNNAGAFGATSGFSYDTSTYTFNIAPANISAVIIEPVAPTGSQTSTAITLRTKNASATNGAGGNISVSTGAGTGTGASGRITFNTATSSNIAGEIAFTGGNGTNEGGAMTFASGNGTGTNGTGGGITIATGTGRGTSGGGGMTISTGNGSGAASFGGAFAFLAGSCTLGTGGDFQLLAGGGATSGSIYIGTDGNSSCLTLTEDGSANAQMGFFNAAPVTQPTTATTAATRVAVAGTVANIGDTYDGYTLAKVVKALRNLGILA